MTRTGNEGIQDIEVVLRGSFPPDTEDYAIRKVRALLRQCPEPVLHARVRLTRHANPAVPRPVAVQINLDLNGRLVRAESNGALAWEAIDAAQAKLRRQLPALARHWEARRGGRSSTDLAERKHSSRAQSLASHVSLQPVSPQASDEPDASQRVVRRTTLRLASETVDEAVVQLARMGYRFYLFAESSSGQDSVVYQAGPAGYRLAQVNPRPRRLAPRVTRLTLNEQPAPPLTVAEATRRLELAGLRFLFFAAADTGRGCVLYRRDDGDYGLITPAP